MEVCHIYTTTGNCTYDEYTSDTMSLTRCRRCSENAGFNLNAECFSKHMKEHTAWSASHSSASSDSSGGSSDASSGAVSDACSSVGSCCGRSSNRYCACCSCWPARLRHVRSKSSPVMCQYAFLTLRTLHMHSPVPGDSLLRSKQLLQVQFCQNRKQCGCTETILPEHTSCRPFELHRHAASAAWARRLDRGCRGDTCCGGDCFSMPILLWRSCQFGCIRCRSSRRLHRTVCSVGRHAALGCRSRRYTGR